MDWQLEAAQLGGLGAVFLLLLSLVLMVIVNIIVQICVYGHPGVDAISSLKQR